MFVKNPSSGVCMVVSQPKTVVFLFQLPTAWGEGGVPSFILHLMGCLAVHNNKTQEMQDIARYIQGQEQLLTECDKAQLFKQL